MMHFVMRKRSKGYVVGTTSLPLYGLFDDPVSVLASLALYRRGMTKEDASDMWDWFEGKFQDKLVGHYEYALSDDDMEEVRQRLDNLSGFVGPNKWELIENTAQIEQGTMVQHFPVPSTTKYLLFEFVTGFGEGGWNDLKGVYDSVEEAQQATSLERDGWEAHIVKVEGLCTTVCATIENYEPVPDDEYAHLKAEAEQAGNETPAQDRFTGYRWIPWREDAT